jgi:putative hydrolase of the HAD superfamily
VIFDLFGTLIATGDQPSRIRNLGEMAHALNIRPGPFIEAWLGSFDQRARGFPGTLEETIHRLAATQGSAPSREQIRVAAAVRMKFCRRLLDPGPQILEGLDALRAAGVRLALVSDTSVETPILWAATPLAARFQTTVFSCRCGIRKPDPRVYLMALDGLELPPGRCAFVGDGGSHELQGAQDVGLKAFRYFFPGEKPEEAYRVDPETSWDGPSITSLLDLLGPEGS